MLMQRVLAKSRNGLWLESLIIVVCCCLLNAGCIGARNKQAALPNKFEIESGNLIVRSDLKIRSDDPLIQQLTTIRHELTETLKLPPSHRPVVIHIFSDENRYSKYMEARHPNLPPRRAFFIGSPTELGVYAHWSPNVGEDLRHEYTHGVLHSCLRTVPLWLDEGLAEYYETELNVPGRLHREHTQTLAMSLKNGWRPDLSRLEKIDDVSMMGLSEYRESWAWIHYLLNDAPGGQELLVDYCNSLRKSDKPPRFSSQVAEYFPDANVRLASYINLSLTDHGRVIRANDSRPQVTEFGGP
ncbi:hypothetical protein SH668x_000625 [Planctomicrobium sp. SH668]|uniref:hypothetical protein n=1 Tax=Planctomicrobium sp. SH668 TaxID=3448126 RepID=UPI003F5B8660